MKIDERDRMEVVDADGPEMEELIHAMASAFEGKRVSPPLGAAALVEMFARCAVNLIQAAHSQEARLSNQKELLRMVGYAQRRIAEADMSEQAHEKTLGALKAMTLGMRMPQGKERLH